MLAYLFGQPQDPRDLALFRFLYATALAWRMTRFGPAHLRARYAVGEYTRCSTR